MSNNQTHSKTTYLVLCSLFAALLAVCSYITIPLPFTPVPVNLGTLGVFLAGGILGRKYGSVCVAVYILMGAVGIPVFAGFQGGIGVLAGPTGGYIVGYLAAAFAIGAILDARMKPAGKKTFILCVCAMAIGLAICYTLGTLWFMTLMNTNLWASLLACVIPFIPGDIIKIAAGALLVRKLRPLIL